MTDVKTAKSDKKFFQLQSADKYLTALLPRLQEKRVQSFTTITLSLITLSFFGIFAIGPTLSTIADLKKQISDDQFVNQQLQQKITNLTNLQVSYKSIQNDIPLVYQAIPETPQVTTIVGQMQTLAQISNVSLLNIQTLPVDISNISSTKYNSFSFALDISGSYANIKTFLQNITNFNRIITIDAMSLSKPTLTQDVYTLSLRGEAYFKANK